MWLDTQMPVLWVGSLLLQKIVQSTAQISLRQFLINFNNMSNYLYLNILETRIALAFLNHKKIPLHQPNQTDFKQAKSKLIKSQIKKKRPLGC